VNRCWRLSSSRAVASRGSGTLDRSGPVVLIGVLS
jgi:hypothetical protein